VRVGDRGNAVDQVKKPTVTSSATAKTIIQ
jgi:hypothetical protein